MKRIAMAIVAGTLSLSALALGAKQANAAEFGPDRRVEYREHRNFRRMHYDHVRARELRRFDRFERRGCER